MNTTQSPSMTSTVNDQQISMLVTFKVKSEMADAFKQALWNDLVNARQEPGCISMHLFEAKDDPNTLFFFERWQDQSALDNHFAQPYTKSVLGLAETSLISPMEILYLNDFAPLPVEDMQLVDSRSDGVDLVVIFEVREGMQERFREQFLNSVKYSRAEPGCVAFHIHAVQTEKSKFVLFEQWQNQEAFDFHLAQSYTQELFATFNITLAKPVEECLIYINELDLPV